ncbi:MAG TPA: ferrous iron transport protein B, partial [Ruminococcaceae bacterium]|nr:ferrous iron transport protein B [Oscillospiraceae bacterium]
MIFALAGNQNSGKTTLFNQLTGSNQHVGNFPGVTVERKDGVIRGHAGAVVVDLPGIYSLSPYSSEEIVTRDFLLRGHPDAIIDIVDATNIERNLYLSMQLIELNIPMVIALNMMDEVRANGGTVKIREFQNAIGVPVVPISASRNDGVEELIEVAVDTARHRRLPRRQDFCAGAVHRTIHSIAHMIEDHAQRIHVPARFAATKLVEGDEPMAKALALSDNEKEMIRRDVTEMEHELHTDREAALADMRYTFIEKLCADTVVKMGESREHRRSVRIDRVLTGKYLAIPIFLLIMMLVFWLTFGVIGQPLSGLLSQGIDAAAGATDAGMKAAGVNPVVRSLVVDGVFAGVGSVLQFLPTIVVLFFFLSILEDSGYMARVAFVMDKLLRKIGLSGRSFVPMLIGFGCSVPAIMATRTLSSERDRKMTILLVPFMSCSAKLPIYAIFTAAFFPHHAVLVMILLYVMGIGMAILSG